MVYKYLSEQILRRRCLVQSQRGRSPRRSIHVDGLRGALREVPLPYLFSESASLLMFLTASVLFTGPPESVTMLQAFSENLTVIQARQLISHYQRSMRLWKKIRNLSITIILQFFFLNKSPLQAKQLNILKLESLKHSQFLYFNTVELWNYWTNLKKRLDNLFIKKRQIILEYSIPIYSTLLSFNIN